MNNLIMINYYKLLTYCQNHDVYKYVMIALAVIMIMELSILWLVYSDNFQEIYEEDLHDFHRKYIVENTLIPIEYRCDINQISNVIKIIKESPNKFKDIPENDVWYIEIQMKIASGEDKIWNKIKRLEKEVIIMAMVFVAVMLNEVLLRSEVYKLFF